ncbi:MAG: glutamate 5-kinase [[Clostridium] fimetarium]|nr:glutamate 5-kinase [Alistipes timonensis]MCM1405810.1 glutamate 5-kinase [[Clostridium] fimetarium]
MRNRRIVVKVGSNVLTRSDGSPDVTIMSGIVDQIAELHKKGHKVILVSSGAVACGRSMVTPARKLDSVGQRQLFSAVGQIRLMTTYLSLFGGHGLQVGQVLTQKENFGSRLAYLNQRSCMEVMLDNNVIPIVNENDTASMTELMFTDNDELSGLIAAMMDADTLVILSNVDGIFTGAPDAPGSTLISKVKLEDDLTDNIYTTKSGFGRGGMGTKYGIAKMLSEEGVRVIIANGRRNGVLTDLVERPGQVPHTEFEPREVPVSNIKRWIAHSVSFAKGRVTVNEDAARMLRGDKAVSLLPIGITSVDGEWEEGDIVNIYAPDGSKMGVGRASCDSAATLAMVGRRGGRPVVHYDYLFME